ncbi:MAG: glycosyltransferase, partial [Boseongicola sp.]
NAVESVLGQSYGNFSLFISIDPSSDRSGEICRSYQDDPRVTVVENETRLGWVGNVNACLDRVTTPYFAFCFHDDVWEPKFLEILIAALDNAPDAVAAFGAIERTGLVSCIDRPGDVRGTPAFRAKDVLKGNFPAYNIKNLMRSGPVLQGLRLPQIGKDGFVADLPFALAYGLAGDFVAVPETVYRKSHRTDSVTAMWRMHEVERFLNNIVLLRTHLIRIVSSAGLAFEDQQELIELILRIRWSQRVDSAEDLHLLADSLDLSSMPLLIANLLDQEVPPAELRLETDKHRVELAESRLKLARGFRKHGDLNAARHYAEQAIRLDAASVEAHCAMARIWLSGAQFGDTQSAIRLAHEHAVTATSLDADEPIAWLILARAQAKQKDWAAVKNSASKSIALGLSEPERAEDLIEQAKKGLRRSWLFGRLARKSSSR